MNETDKKRLEEIEQLYRDQDGVWCSMQMPWLISHLKDAIERESRVRELHFIALNEHSETIQYCDECGSDWPCSTIAILDGGEG